LAGDDVHVAFNAIELDLRIGEQLVGGDIGVDSKSSFLANFSAPKRHSPLARGSRSFSRNC